MNNRPKATDILKTVREKVISGELRYSNHANQRMAERGIIKPEIEYVLKTGRHNQRKDHFNEEQKGWDYAVEGKTIDNRRLRIIVAIIRPDLLVVTAIDLDARD